MNGPDLTSEEIKQPFGEELITKAKTFKPQGIGTQAARDYLETSEGRLYSRRLLEASPDATIEDLHRRAVDTLSPGRELPRMETIDEPLVKIVPKGSEPSPHSPFCAMEVDLDAAVKEEGNLSQRLGSSVARKAAAR